MPENPNPNPAGAESDDDASEHVCCKKPRTDENWRLARAVRARDQKLDKLKLEKDALAERNVALKKTAAKERAKVKQLEHEKYTEAKKIVLLH